MVCYGIFWSGKGTGAENASRNCFWDRSWGRAGQLLLPRNNPRSLFKG